MKGWGLSEAMSFKHLDFLLLLKDQLSFKERGHTGCSRPGWTQSLGL